MKLTEIFRKKQASAFSSEVDPFTTLNHWVNPGSLIGKGYERKTRSTEDDQGVFRTTKEVRPFDRTLPPISLASPSECNCSQILGIQDKTTKGLRVNPNDTPEDVEERLKGIKNLHEKTFSPDILRDADAYRDGWTPDNIETTKQFHKEVVDKWLGLMREPDDTKRLNNVNILAKLTRKQPLADSGDEFNNHFLMHLYNAGDASERITKPVEEGGLGVEHLGRNFRESQGVAQRAEVAARKMPNYNKDNCGVCEQYKNMYQSDILKYKQENENSKASGEGGKALFPEDENKSAMEIYRDVYHEFMTSQRRKTADNPTIASAYNTLEKFNQHQKEAHNVTFSNMYDKYTPVADDNDTRTYAKNLFENIRGIGNGWKLRDRTRTPREKTNPFSDPDSRNRPGFWGPEVSDVEKAVAKKMNYPTTTNLTGIGLNVKMETEADGKILSLIKPEGTPAGEGSYFTKSPAYERTIGLQEYDPSADPRRKLFDKPLEDVEHPEITREDLRKLDIPRFHKYVFQKAGFYPRMKSQEDYQSSLGRAGFDLKIKFEKERKRTNPKAIPYKWDQFINLLGNEHDKAATEAEKRIKRSRLPGMVGPTASKKRDIEMPTFNSRNSKEAHVPFDPNAIDFHGIGGAMWHGIKDVGHMLNTPINQVRDLLHYKNEFGSANGRAQDAAYQLLGEGIAADQLLKRKFDTSLREQAGRPLDFAKRKLYDRRDLNTRKRIWDAWPQETKAMMVDTHGRSANPYHPNHDLSLGYSLDEDGGITRTSSIIASLSDKIAGGDTRGKAKDPKSFTYYDAFSSNTPVYRGPDINKECERCGIPITGNKSVKLCRDCRDVLSAKPSED